MYYHIRKHCSQDTSALLTDGTNTFKWKEAAQVEVVVTLRFKGPPEAGLCVQGLPIHQGFFATILGF
jgi:hypothetical protein